LKPVEAEKKRKAKKKCKIVAFPIYVFTGKKHSVQAKNKLQTICL
jgi:hypothetical protein